MGEPSTSNCGMIAAMTWCASAAPLPWFHPGVSTTSTAIMQARAPNATRGILPVVVVVLALTLLLPFLVELSAHDFVGRVRPGRVEDVPGARIGAEVGDWVADNVVPLRLERQAQVEGRLLCGRTRRRGESEDAGEVLAQRMVLVFSARFRNDRQLGFATCVEEIEKGFDGELEGQAVGVVGGRLG